MGNLKKGLLLQFGLWHAGEESAQLWRDSLAKDGPEPAEKLLRVGEEEVRVPPQLRNEIPKAHVGEAKPFHDLEIFAAAAVWEVLQMSNHSIKRK